MEFKANDIVYIMDYIINDSVVNTEAIFIRYNPSWVEPYKNMSLVQINGCRTLVDNDRIITREQFLTEMKKRNKEG